MIQQVNNELNVFMYFDTRKFGELKFKEATQQILESTSVEFFMISPHDDDFHHEKNQVKVQFTTLNLVPLDEA